MTKIRFDVMLRGRFICTMTYEHCPAFVLTEQEIVDFVISKLPTLRNQPFNIEF